MMLTPETILIVCIGGILDGVSRTVVDFHIVVREDVFMPKFVQSPNAHCDFSRIEQGLLPRIQIIRANCGRYIAVPNERNFAVVARQVRIGR